MPLTPPPERVSKKSDAQAVPSRAPSSSTTKDLVAVDELLDTMKRAFNAMSVTFDVLSQQTTKVADLGPVIDAKHQVRPYGYAYSKLI